MDLVYPQFKIGLTETNATVGGLAKTKNLVLPADK
jgi:hypothetical protein